MEYKQATSTIANMAKQIRFAGMIIMALLICNFVLCALAWHLSGRENMILVPMGLKSRASLSHGTVSAAYLESTAIFFVNERLNVTPVNVVGSDKELLKFVNPGFYSGFKDQLESDEQSIKSSQISSTFYIDEVQSNPKNLTVTVRGHLKRWVGSRYLGSDEKSYQLSFSMSGYQLLLDSFKEINTKRRG